MISKELLSEVLEIDICEDVAFIDNSTYAYPKPISSTNYVWELLNIYELAHKCKVWAYKLDEYNISSGLTNGGAYTEVFGRYACSDSNANYQTTANIEAEAIFKACEWILKETK